MSLSVENPNWGNLSNCSCAFPEGRVCAQHPGGEQCEGVVTHKVTAEQNGQRVTLAYLCSDCVAYWPEQFILGLPPFPDRHNWCDEVSAFDVEPL